MDAFPHTLRLAWSPGGALLALLVLVLVPASAARAGEYPMDQCRDPADRAAPVASLYGSSPGTSLRDSCPAGGTLTLVPPPGRLEQGAVNAILASVPAEYPHVRVARVRIRFNAGAVEDPAGDPHVQLHGSGVQLYDAPARPYALVDLTRDLPGDARTFSLSSVCFGSAGCRYPYGDELNVFSLRATLSEAAPPAVGATGGSLLAGGARSGRQEVVWEAADEDSGVRSVRLLIDGTRVAARAAACRFVLVRPCAARFGGAFTVDTGTLADGPHRVDLEAEDAAGTAALRALGVVTVDNVPDPGDPDGPAGPAGPAGPVGPMGPAGAPGAVGLVLGTGPNGTGATALAVLRARFEATSRRTRRVRYGARVWIAGRLTRPDGAPITGARVDVLTRVRVPGAPLRARGQVTTGADGSFSYLAPAGPSRLLRFGYRALLSDVELARTSDVALRVRPGLSLRVSRRRARNGQAVTFRGRLRGLPRGARKVVELQARTGGRWMTFATALARRAGGGRLRRRYRFTRTRRPRTYRFRARVRRESGFPYETGSSRVVRVRVR